MSDPLSIPDHLVARGRLMMRIGRPLEARRLFRRLLGHPELPDRTRAEALQAVAAIDMDSGQFRRARRLLAAAIRLRRHADDLYREYAAAVTADPDADPRLAVKALRRAVAIDPDEVRSWAALGTAALRAGDRSLARKAFRRAARLRPESASILQEIAHGLLELDREAEARAVVTAVRFGASNDADITGVWDWLQFALARRRQRKGQDEERTVLRFPTTPRESVSHSGEAVVLRADRKSAPTPHLLRLIGRSGPRQAQ